MAATSDYYSKLSVDSKKRYMEKISKIDFVDPYCLTKMDFLFDKDFYPKVTYPDLVTYLLLAPSPVTKEELKSYKSMEAYNQFHCGWVREIGVKLFHDGKVTLVHGRVMHSQRLSEAPTLTWIIAESDGYVLSAHCDCMAGLGESCSHVGAILFHIEATVRLSEKKTVTGEKAYWMLPSAQKNVAYAEVSNIDFTAPQSLKKKFDESLACLDDSMNEVPSATNNKEDNVKGPSQEKLSSFFKELSLCGSKPAILSLVAPYDDNYVPKSLQENVPPILRTMFNSNLLGMDRERILNYCAGVAKCLSNISADQQKQVEEITKQQQKSNLWYLFRAGRITASKMYAISHTSMDNPSLSLLKCICYPEITKFYSVATSWGCKLEEHALDLYRNVMMKEHQKFRVSKCGLFLSLERAYIGASPDGLAYCSCCGEGCVEIKCPFKHKDVNISEAVERDDKFCLYKDDNGVIKLRVDHSYYYQIQTQLYVCQKDYCDFVVYTTKALHIERIVPNLQFLSNLLSTCELFFKNIILPEVVSKYFTQKLSDKQIDLDQQEVSLYCYCNGQEAEELYACSNKKCTRKLFHLKCVKLVNKPRKTWLCPDCNNQ